MATLLQDIRFGARMLWRNRLTTLVSLIALGLGIGANTAMFSVAEAFLLHPAPFENSDKLVALLTAKAQENVYTDGIATATYLDWKDHTRCFEDLAAYQWDEVNLTGDSQPQKVQAFAVSPNFFSLVGVQPQIGRAFALEESEPGKDHEIILSYGLWETRYASDPSILSKTVKVDGISYSVIGVMRSGFDFPKPAEAWIPLAWTPQQRQDRNTRSNLVVAKLRPGVTLAAAQAEMRTSFERMSAEYPNSYTGLQLRILPLKKFLVGAITEQYTLLLLVAVGFVLLIACVNVANVQFARVSGRAKEFAVRASLGGSRWRIVRQLLVESVLLALAGSALGLLFGQWSIKMILAHMPPDVAKFIAGWKTISLDLGAFLYTLGIAVAAGLVSGVAPALLSTRKNVGAKLNEATRGSSAGAGRHRLRSILVVAEVSLALILLVGAGLLVKNFSGLIAVNDAYAPPTLLTLSLSLPEKQYAQAPSRLSFHERTLERLQSLPGVQDAALVTLLPYAQGGGPGQTYFSIQGRAPASRGEIVSAIVETVSPNYFGMLDIALHDGRLLSPSDGASSEPVCLISESLVRRYFPANENPLGRKIKVGAATDDAPWMTIVGIVSDVRYSWIEKELVPTIYRNFRQSPRHFTTIILRSKNNAPPLQLVSAVRTQISAIDPDLPLYDIQSFDTLITQSIIGIAYVATMMGVLGVIALVLACVGLYGVMSYSVSERIHEIGIRMSLGATVRDILRMVLQNGLLLTFIGLLIGLPISFVMARALSSVLFGVSANDPVALFALPALLVAVATVACYLPARRAARIDPLRALRYE